MTVTDSMYIQVYKYIPYKLCIYGIYMGAGLYIRYRHIPSNADWASAFMPWNGSTITFNPTVMYHWYYTHILYLYIIPLRI